MTKHYICYWLSILHFCNAQIFSEDAIERHVFILLKLNNIIFKLFIYRFIFHFCIIKYLRLNYKLKTKTSIINKWKKTINFIYSDNEFVFKQARLFRLEGINKLDETVDGGFWSLEKERFQNTKNKKEFDRYYQNIE